MTEDTIAVRFPDRRALHRAERALGDAVDSVGLDVRAYATVRLTLGGRVRLRHGLPPSAAQTRELRLLTAASISGVGVDLLPDRVGRPQTRRVEHHLLDLMSGHLVHGEAGLAIVVGGALPLMLAETLRHGRPSLLLSTYRRDEHKLFESALV